MCKQLLNIFKLAIILNMKKTRLSKIFDFLFGTSFVFLMCFVWMRFFLHNFVLTILLSFVISFCVCGLYYFLSKQKAEKQQLSETELEKAHNISMHFLLSTKKETISELEKLLSKKYDVTAKSDHLIVNDTMLKPIYTSQTISDKDVLESFAKIKNTSLKKLIICCENASSIAMKIASLIKEKEVVVLDEYLAYKNIFLPLGFNPPKVEIEEKKKDKKFDVFLQNAFNKKRTKNYLLVAVFLLFGSFLLRYNLYYIIFSSIATLCALYSHFNTRFNK
ncbi:MAG TPA: hypothetical protein DCZ34_01100, partial [Clostridiales bacterium]|nr:hypothetical protein [Clostridiales bacterium]